MGISQVIIIKPSDMDCILTGIDTRPRFCVYGRGPMQVRLCWAGLECGSAGPGWNGA